MLLILMYHRAVDCQYGNPAATIRAHFSHLRQHYPVCLPGEPLRPGRLNVCLTFDDAYADFYGYVFPLLKEFSLKAVLAVPTAFIVERTALSLEKRISSTSDDAMQIESSRTQVPFCTWEELQLMSASGLVEIASHSHNHVDLTQADSDPRAEAIQSKTILEQRLGRKVSTFVFPFGRVNARAYQEVSSLYPYTMRIGAALNMDWLPKRQPLCRVGADQISDIANLMRWPRLLQYGLKWTGNQFRAAARKWDRR